MSAGKLGNHMKALRAEARLTQAELAARVGVTRKTINTVENGVFTPSALLALKIARALGRGTDEVFFVED
ncbi:MAG: helix-turn-helix transcriptional regulator [Pseudomonadota bacterium]